MNPNKQKNPQLYGTSRAAKQARRAAGVVLEGEPVDPFVENQHPITAVKSGRKLIRSMAKGEKLPSRYLKVVTKMFSEHRRAVLGLIPEEVPEVDPRDLPNEVENETTE